MRRDRGGKGEDEPVISIIGPETRVQGDVEAEGSVRVEGTVQGNVTAGKAVVLGQNGLVEGDVITQDAVLAGTIRGAVVAQSRLELQSTCNIQGEVRTRRLQLEEGAVLNGKVFMGDDLSLSPPARASDVSSRGSRKGADASSESQAAELTG